MLIKKYNSLKTILFKNMLYDGPVPAISFFENVFVNYNRRTRRSNNYSENLKYNFFKTTWNAAKLAGINKNLFEFGIEVNSAGTHGRRQTSRRFVASAWRLFRKAAEIPPPPLYPRHSPTCVASITWLHCRRRRTVYVTGTLHI